MLDTAQTFREATLADVPALIALGEHFFDESDFGTFTSYDPKAFEATLASLIVNPSGRIFLFAPDDAIRGFIAFSLDKAYTTDLVALLFLFYVAPDYRGTPAGRLLLALAVDAAAEEGAKAFWAGAMAGIPGVSGSLANLYRKMGFQDMDFWGRKLL